MTFDNNKQGQVLWTWTRHKSKFNKSNGGNIRIIVKTQIQKRLYINIDI